MALRFNRRSLLRGLVGGSAIGVGLPALNIFLHGNGLAWADGSRLPTRFGTYFWGLGLTDTPQGGTRWAPKKTGKGYEETPELKSFADIRHKVSVFSGFRVIGDGKPNIVHWSGHTSILSGFAPGLDRQMDGPSFDTKVGDFLGASSRFRQIDLSACGLASANYSTRTGRTFATPELTPISLYSRLFGEGFQDPNDANWKPSPDVMVRRSVLSGIADQRQALLADVGKEDQQKLDQYFTSIREVENELSLQLQQPEKCESCVVPKRPDPTPKAVTLDVVNGNAKMMAKLLAMGLACDQTRVFNMVHSPGSSITYMAGDTKT